MAARPLAANSTKSSCNTTDRQRVPMSAIPPTATKQRNVAKGQLRKSVPSRVGPPPFHQIVSAIASAGAGPGDHRCTDANLLRRRRRGQRSIRVWTSLNLRASREGAPHRRTDGVVRERYWRLLCRIRGGTGAVGLDGRPQCANRAAVDAGGPKPRECFCNGAYRVAARRYLLLEHGGDDSTAPGDQYHPNRVCDRQRPVRLGVRREPGHTPVATLRDSCMWRPLPAASGSVC